LALGLAVRLALAGALAPTPEELATWAGDGSAAAHLAAAVGTTALGTTPLGLRVGGVVAAGLAPALLLAKARDPFRFVFGVLALPAAVWSGLLAGPASWVYAAGCALLGAALAERVWARVGLAGLGAALLVAGTAGAERSAGSWVWALAAGGVLALPATPWAAVAAVSGDRADRTCLGVGSVGVVAGAWIPGLAALGWTALLLGLCRAGGGFARGTWVASGVGLFLCTTLAAHSARPMVALEGDPTARLGIGADLGRGVQAWGLPAYTEDVETAALLRWYGGVDARVVPEGALVGAALYVRPWRGVPSTEIDARCPDRSGANVVSEYNPDGSALQRWQVYETGPCGGTP